VRNRLHADVRKIRVKEILTNKELEINYTYESNNERYYRTGSYFTAYR
jgi:hypothetical protein